MQGCEGACPSQTWGESCLQASGNPIHSEEPEPAAAFPLAICKSVKYSRGATCESRLTPLSVSLPQLTPTVVVLPEGASGLAHMDFLFSFRIPVVMLLDACQWLMIKYSY